MAEFNVRSGTYVEGLWKTMKGLSQDEQSSGQYLNLDLPNMKHQPLDHYV
jgi:hypothetical protein